MLKFSFDFNLFNNQYFIYERLLVTLFALVPTIMLVIFTLKSDKKSSEPKKKYCNMFIIWYFNNFFSTIF